VGTKSAHMIPVAISGCASDLGIMMSDVYLSGKEHDLSALSVDISQKTKLNIEVVNKKLTVFANDNALYSGSYNVSIGNIVGLRFRFLGAGEVATVKLSNLSGSEIIINETFQ
jgi:hypothetical protein